MEVDGNWIELSGERQTEIRHARKNNNNVVVFSEHGFDYVFDLQAMFRINVKTKKTRPLREIAASQVKEVVMLMEVIQPFSSQYPGYLTLTPGDRLEVCYEGKEKSERGWNYGRKSVAGASSADNPLGWFPAIIANELL